MNSGKGDGRGFVVNLCVCVPGAVGNGWGLGEVRVWGGQFKCLCLEVQRDGA